MTVFSFKNAFLLAVIMAIATFLWSIYANHMGRDLDVDRTDAYLKSVERTASSIDAKRLPNIVLILADDLGYGDISSFGAKLIQTPNIDQLAKNGLKMTNFYSPSALCSPARASVLTGRYPPRTHVPAVLFDSGTAINTIRKYGGFYSYGMDGIAPDEATLAEVLKAGGYTNALIGKWHLGSRAGYLPEDNGFDVVYTPDKSVDVTAYTQQFTEKSLQFISENKHRPFFLYYATTVPHEPLHRVERFAEQTSAGMYGEMILELDWSVGRIMRQLEELGIVDNTLVIFTSDNGPYRMGSAGEFRGGKGLTTLGGQRVPFVASWPDAIPAGQVSDELSMGIDVFPTVLEMSGIPLPTDRIIDGKSILPLLTGVTNTSPHDYLFMINDTIIEAVLDSKGYKYQIQTSPDSSKFWYLSVGPYLFDTQVDPSESYSILETMPEKATELAEQISRQQSDLKTRLRGWK